MKFDLTLTEVYPYDIYDLCIFNDGFSFYIQLDSIKVLNKILNNKEIKFRLGKSANRIVYLDKYQGKISLESEAKPRKGFVGGGKSIGITNLSLRKFQKQLKEEMGMLGISTEQLKAVTPV